MIRHPTLGNIPVPPSRPTGTLGNIPRGFFEIAEPSECSDTAPAFLRGYLEPKKDYDARSFEAKTRLLVPPRWILYGGPLPTRIQALQWSDYLFFWAVRNGYIWLSEGQPCIVENYRLPWPQDSSFQWTWVREIEYPRRVRRDPSSSVVKYVWEGQEL